MPESKIRIQGLTKIFGPKPHTVLNDVKQGMDKQTLLKKYQHILGLHNVSLDLQGQQIEVIMGLSGSGR